MRNKSISKGSAGMSELLKMTGIGKSFGPVRALNDVSLSLSAGEVLALMGENGAGKSTLMNILSGSLVHYEGEIYIDGKLEHVGSPLAARALGIAKIHQELQMAKELSIAENMFMGREKANRFGFVDKRAQEREAEKYLKMLELDLNPRRQLKTLRVGEQQMVEIAKAMGEAERGNLDVAFDTEHYSGEIRQLGGSFNSMMDKIRNLIELVYKEQRDKREAEIRTLQAQIKPHFLYNTLDTIRWMAEEHQADEIVQLVSALTRLFRISQSRGREIISLADEMEHVRSYLYIQKVRYEEKLNYALDVPEELLQLRVNKLILQPLVENAIYHGIKQKRGVGHIRLCARREEDVLRITVEGDGAGMTMEKCALLNTELSSPAGIEYDHGYGIFNVNDRIRLSYGPEFGLRYEINTSGGITVTLRFPAILRDADGEKGA